MKVHERHERMSQEVKQMSWDDLEWLMVRIIHEVPGVLEWFEREKELNNLLDIEEDATTEATP